MKRLLATTAVATMAFAGAASAQSVLERVLGQIDNATNLASVNGTFANIAENIGTPGQTTVYSVAADGDLGTVLGLTDPESVSYTADELADIANVLTADLVAGVEGLDSDGNVTTDPDEIVGYSISGNIGSSSVPANEFSTLEAAEAYAAQLVDVFLATEAEESIVLTGGVDGIDGSINNVIDGITDVTQEAVAGTVTAIEYNMPTFDFGDMATTALGAVNTGDITLGVNSAVDEASTSTTNAISAVVNQLGGSADTGAIVLNVASNMTGVNGSINNVMEEVNGSIGNLSTTALGAVNTGTIVSGVDAAVAGIVGSTSGGAVSN